jgi:hypothetical protein
MPEAKGPGTEPPSCRFVGVTPAGKKLCALADIVINEIEDTKRTAIKITVNAEFFLIFCNFFLFSLNLCGFFIYIQFVFKLWRKITPQKGSNCSSNSALKCMTAVGERSLV